MKLAPIEQRHVRLLPRGRKEFAMIDLTEEEHMAIIDAMRLVAEIMEEIGWETRLMDLTRDQVMTLIEVAVGGFQEALRDIVAATPRTDPEVPF